LRVVSPVNRDASPDSEQDGPVSLQDRVERLFFEAREDVYYYLMTFSLASHEAQEITQDVFLRLYAALKGGEAIETPRAWIFRVAHNLALQSIERGKTRRLVAIDLRTTAPRHGEDPEKGIIRRQTAARLNEAMLALSPQQKLCLQMRAEGLKYVEIARTLGVSPSTVGEFLSRAIKKLRKVVHE
jgi:RNA polymerase sigma-70 factor (ECF subfamily)